MLTITIDGLEIPDAGRVFLVTLSAHVLTALTSVGAGAVAAIAGKRPGRHPGAGRVYFWGLTGVFATATVMAVIRWREDWHLLLIATVACGLGWFGWLARRRHRPGWPRRHAIGMGGSFMALLTGFYVDNGPHLPIWNHMPHWVYWVLPTAVGSPLTWWALRRFRSRSAPGRA